jgi:hypothetical protein
MNPSIHLDESYKHPDESGCWSHGGSEINMAGIVAAGSLLQQAFGTSL